MRVVLFGHRFNQQIILTQYHLKKLTIRYKCNSPQYNTNNLNNSIEMVIIDNERNPFKNMITPEMYACTLRFVQKNNSQIILSF